MTCRVLSPAVMIAVQASRRLNTFLVLVAVGSCSPRVRAQRVCISSEYIAKIPPLSDDGRVCCGVNLSCTFITAEVSPGSHLGPRGSSLDENARLFKPSCCAHMLPAPFPRTDIVEKQTRQCISPLSPRTCHVYLYTFAAINLRPSTDTDIWGREVVGRLSGGGGRAGIDGDGKHFCWATQVLRTGSCRSMCAPRQSDQICVISCGQLARQYRYVWMIACGVVCVLL